MADARGGSGLTILANETARRWLRQQRAFDPPAEAEQLTEELRTLRRQTRLAHVRLLREMVLNGLCHEVVQRLGVVEGEAGVSGLTFWFLVRAFPEMPDCERAEALRWAWCSAHLGSTIPTRRVLSLFMGSQTLRATVPKDWPESIQVYRGNASWSWEQSRRRVRRGIAWTTDRTIALRFGTPREAPPPTLFDGEPTPSRPLRRLWAGHVGMATVRRADVLAYFHDSPGVLGHHEHECIIDPRVIRRVTYERLPPVQRPVPM
jgi:hypothetical protein